MNGDNGGEDVHLWWAEMLDFHLDNLGELVSSYRTDLDGVSQGWVRAAVEDLEEAVRMMRLELEDLSTK